MIHKNRLEKLLNKWNTASIKSRSNQVTNKVISKIDFKNANIIVEYGSGTGIVSKQILNSINKDAVLFVFETNEQCINDLILMNNRRLVIINEDVLNAQIILKNRYKIEKVDCIISSKPLLQFSTKKHKIFIDKTYNLLKENGKFITYQYTGLMNTLLKERFSRSHIKPVLKNIPPVFILEGIK